MKLKRVLCQAAEPLANVYDEVMKRLTFHAPMLNVQKTFHATGLVYHYTTIWNNAVKLAKFAVIKIENTKIWINNFKKKIVQVKQEEANRLTHVNSKEKNIDMVNAYIPMVVHVTIACAVKVLITKPHWLRIHTVLESIVELS